MFIVRGDLPTGARTAWKALIKDTFLTTKKDYEKIATVLPSTTKTETYDWLYAMPGVQEWLGERRLRSPKFGTYSLTNRKWEITVPIEQDVIDDDRLGIVTPRIKELGIKGINHIDKLCFQTLAAGFTTAGPDGAYYFADSGHAEGTTNCDNKITTVFSAESHTVMQTLIQTMLRFPDTDGEPLGLRGDLLVGPPELETKFRTELYTDYFPVAVGTPTGTMSNVWKGAADMLVSPWLTDTTDYFFLCTSQPLKPILLQMRQWPTSDELSAGSDVRFMQDVNLFGIKGRYVCGYTLWQLGLGALVAG
jgi:phage major head subunit gpT-like protein